MEEEESEDECLVLVELAGIIDNGFLHSCGTKCKLLGVETDNPFLQLGHYVFKGEYEDLLGTAVLFETEQSDARPSSEGNQERKERLKYYDKTQKKLNMIRAFLSAKDTKTAKDSDKSKDK